MAATIYELFGYPALDFSPASLEARERCWCPFLQARCTKTLGSGADKIPSGVCSIKQITVPYPVICCPNRLYADNYKILGIVAEQAFSEKCSLYPGRVALLHADKEHTVAVFGHGWHNELPLPTRQRRSRYYVDWVLAALSGNGMLREFTAAEVQTIDTTGNYREGRRLLLSEHRLVKTTAGLNWENVNKRIIPQIIFKGQVLQRETLCRSGLYFVCTTPVLSNILARLGGTDKLPEFPSQPASIHFVAYDYAENATKSGVVPLPLSVQTLYSTTVYKVQEAFSAIDLPDADVFRDAIEHALETE